MNVVTVKLVNDTDKELEVFFEWLDQDCYMDYLGNLHCQIYIGVGVMYINDKRYERGGEVWYGEPWIFKLKRNGFGEIGNKFRIRWDYKNEYNNNVTLIYHDFTITEDLIEVISKASEAEPWLKNKK